MPIAIRSLAGILTPTSGRSGLRVEAWDDAGICADLIDVALTDARGGFDMQLGADYLAKLLLSKAPVLAFRVFDNGKPLGLPRPVTWNASQQATSLQIPLAAATTSVPVGSPASSVVRGTVLNGDGSPAANRVVRAFDRNLAATGFADTPIGQATTAADGQYEIRYTMAAGGKLKPDLIVRVAAAASTGTNLPAGLPVAPRGAAAASAPASAATAAPAVAAPAPVTRPAAPGTTVPPAPISTPAKPAAPPAAESGLISSAPTVAFVDLSLDDIAMALLSEHATFLAPVTEIAARSKIALADLTAAHLGFVAGAAGLQPERVRQMVQAAQLARDAGGAVDAEVFYGLLRTGHDGDLVALAAVPIQVQRRRIQNAIDANLISASHDPDVVITALQGAIVARALPEKGSSIVATALSNSLSTRDVHAAFVARWVGRTGSVQEFWDDVRADPALSPAAGDLETTLRFDMLFDGFAPALADLRTQRQAKTIASMRDLARWQDADWQSFLARVGTPAYIAGDTPGAKADAYARTLQPTVRRAFPTEFLRGRAAVKAVPIATRFVSLLAASNPDLDLTRPLPDDPAWGSIAAADQPAARAEWAAFQREARPFRAMPARSLLEAVVKAGGANPVRTAANRFLVATTDLDLEHTTVEQYLSANPKALDGIDQTIRPAVFGYLKGVQRVMRVVRAPEAVEALIADGLDSALRIARVPRSEFVERYSTILGGVADAHAVFSTAFRTATTAQLALTTTVQSVSDVSVWAIRGGTSATVAAPDRSAVLGLLKSAAAASDGTAAWPTLFKGEAWCDCDDCQSIYGPAAYFVDLLHMIDPDGSDPAPATHLFKRRPDLPNLSLTCDNTNVALPYIDVVNEILELHVAAGRGFDVPGTTRSYATSTSYDSTGLSAAELRAVPQNVIHQVYDDVLASDAYPLTLPFHRSLAVMRTYLDQLGASYADLLSAFGPSAADHGLSSEQRVAAETLGLSRRAFKLIADVAVDQPATTLAGCYGYDATQDPQWQAKLSVIPDLLRRTGISYDDLNALVGTSGTYFMKRTGTVSLDPPAQCQIDDATRLHPASDTFNRLHRFIRLWRATGWSIADLDRVLFAVGAGSDHVVTLDADTLPRVAQVKRITDQLEQPLTAVLSLWSDLDTWGADAWYLRLFQNRTVTRLDDATSFLLAGDPAKKPANGVGELATATDPMAPHAATILAALRITSSDLAAIRSHAISVDAFPVRDASGEPLLNLRNLTVVYRYTVLAKGLGLRIADLIAILELTGADPFTPNDPAGAAGLIEQARAIQASGCSIATLAYVYQCASAPGQGPAPADSVMFDALAKIWTALRGVRHDTVIADDPDGTQLAARLALLQPPDVVTSILAALDPAKGLSPIARKQILDDSLASILGADLAGLEAQVLAADPTDSIALAERKVANGAALLFAVSAALRRSLSESSVISVVAGTLGLGDAMTRRLLVEWIPGALDALLELAGGGLNAQRFDAAQFANPEGTPAIDETIAWSATATATPRGVKWSGRILPLGDGAHTFVLRSDGACSIAIGGAPATAFAAQLDGGRPLAMDHPVTVTLTANQLVEIDVAYDSGTAPGSFALSWKLGAATTASPIAPEYLFPSLTALVQDDRGPGFVWRRAHKAALLIGGLGLSQDEVAYAESGDLPFGPIDVGNLPMHPPAAGDVHAHLAGWQALADFVAVRRSLPISDITLVDVLEGRTAAGVSDPLAWWAQQLSAPTGWDPAALQPLLVAVPDWTVSGSAIVAQLLVGVAGPVPAGGPFALGRRLAAAQRCLDLIRRIGVAGDAPAGTRPTLRAWVVAEPDAQAAREVVQAVRARYPDDAQWYQVAQTRNDTLRQLQRDALVAHLLPRITIDNAPARDVNALYEHFLIDVEMCACGETSRVLQGISTVQLFIQRILLGLEPPISPSRIDPDRWEWNEEYRVWQANREIFLYPENWIDPELRVDKTPFFADLQAQLSQGPLEPDTVEAAFENYLLKLEQVSRLEVCALHWEREGTLTDADSELANDRVIDTLHVVARTPGLQAAYYYRTLLGTAAGNGGTEWTPWQKVDVDIQGDGDRGDVHMVLTTDNRRLYLFWAIFAETPEPSQPGMNQGDSPPPPLTHWDIRLGWSTCRNGVWSPKQVTAGTIRSNRYIDIDDKGGYAHAIHEAQHQRDQLRKRKNDAQQHVDEHEHALWLKLQNLRTVLVFLITQRVQQFNVAENPENDDDLFHQCLFYWLSPLFNHTPTNLPMLEAWIKDQNESFTDFLDKIYQALHVFGFLDGLPNFPAPYVESELLDDYDDVQAYRTARDDAKAASADFQASYQAFVDGRAPLSVASSTRRSDHTLWLSTADGVDIYVLRHDDRDHPRELGWFSVSEDGRSIAATAAPAGRRLDIGRQVPHHSDPATNAFRIDTKGHKGLDLEGLPNLLGRVHEARFYHEHWFRHPVTSDSLRPFFIAKGSDLEVGLPVADQSVHEPTDPLTTHQGLAIMGARDSAAVKTAGATESRDAAAVATAANADAPALAQGTMVRLGEQKSFGLAVVAANPDRSLASTARYCFEPFHHPFVHSLIKRLERDGVDGLLTVEAQNPSGSDGGEKGKHFDTRFDPSAKLVAYKYSPHDVDFRPQGPYAAYNWELFFHAPLLIAARLTQDGRYDDARRWLHYIFDPTTSSTAPEPTRFWKLQPFRDNTDTLNASQLMTALATNGPAQVAASVHAQIDQWHRYPADPHRIARLRLSAYQKAVVFAYLDNLIAWADSLFAQDTIETINQATQLYVFASHLLGPRPQRAENAAAITAFTYAQLRGHLDAMSDLVAEVETMLHPARAFQMMSAPKAVASSFLGISHLPVLYPAPIPPDVPEVPLMFCVPPNGKLLTYFDTIDDRLFKIRHCMNIEGVVQQLPLFQPPIDPALLVRAAAMGLDIGSILADLSAPLPFHRYAVMVQKALELCGELRALGGQLLTALEKQDAESLALLRASHDSSLLKAVLEVKKQQGKEAETNKTALQRTRDVTQARYDYYASREFTNSWENQQLDLMDSARTMQEIGGAMIAASGSFFGIPTLSIGPTGMGVHATAVTGGPNVGESIKAVGQGMTVAAQDDKDAAAMSGILGSQHRRQDEWNFQKDVAGKELAQIDRQLAAADIKIAMTSLELANQQLQIDNAKKIEDTLRTKYTNTELYSWMVTQVSSTYYQAYKLAYDLAKRAERCYRYDLGLASSSFIQFGYWDSLRKGLYAGEQLALDLKRMDASFLQADRRNYEIARHISLVLHDPQAFVDLRKQGWCEVDLPEELFDADYPGHFFRRIKSISLTLPCVAGPYTPINCTLTLLSSHVRITAVPGARYPELNAPDDARFSHSYGAIQSVATSHGQNDAGLFEVNFRDERYLPFEGAGAVSRWRIDLPHDCNAFDADTLSDVVMRLSYTARDGGKPLADAARKSLRARWATTDQEDGVTPMTPLRRLFRVRYEFSDAWVQFRNALATGDAALLLTIDRDRFPYLFRGVPITIVGAQLIATLSSAITQPSLTLTMTPPQGQPKDVTLSPTPADASMLVSGQLDPPAVDVAGSTGWRVAAKAGFPIAAVRDLALVLTYTVKVPPYTH